MSLRNPTASPDVPHLMIFFDGWQEIPDGTNFDNAFKIQCEKFLRHVALDQPFP